MAACGAKVLMLRCVEYARRYGVPLHVRSSYNNKPGTMVSGSMEDIPVEQAMITGVAHDRSEAKVTVVGRARPAGRGRPDLPGGRRRRDQHRHGAAERLAHGDRRTDITFTLPKATGRPLSPRYEETRPSSASRDVLYDDHVGKVSLVGAGMRSHPGVTATFCEALAKAGVNIEIINTSEIRISVLCRDEQLDEAVRAIHAAFELGGDEAADRVRGDRPMSRTVVDGGSDARARRRHRRGRHRDDRHHRRSGVGAVGGGAADRVAALGRAGAARAGRGADCRGAVAGGRSTAWTWRCSTCRTRSARSGPRIAAARGAVVVDNSGRVPDGPRRAAGGAGGQRRRGRAPAARDHRQPELHDAVDDGRARRAAPRVRAARAGVRLLPGGVRRWSGRRRTGCTPSWPRWPARGSACGPATSPRRWTPPGWPRPTRRSPRRWR